MFQLEIKQEFETSLEALFSAWCDVDTIKQWFSPGDMTVPEAIADVKVGGQYRIVMLDSAGEKHIVAGIYEEIEVNRKLVFTWHWEGSPNTTIVSIDFKALGSDRSSLNLTHSEFIEEGFRDKHEQGWQGCLANLHKIID